eukprot:4520221-Prymnesium_polylepis.1
MRKHAACFARLACFEASAHGARGTARGGLVCLCVAFVCCVLWQVPILAAFALAIAQGHTAQTAVRTAGSRLERAGRPKRRGLSV